MSIVCCKYSEMQLSFKIMYLEFVSNILNLGFVIQFWNKLPFFGFQLLCLRVLQIGVWWRVKNIFFITLFKAWQIQLLIYLYDFILGNGF